MFVFCRCGGVGCVVFVYVVYVYVELVVSVVYVELVVLVIGDYVVKCVDCVVVK